MGKIGDLWVKLGLKKDDLEKGLKGAEKALDNFSNGPKGVKAILGGLKTGFAGFAAAAAASLAKAFIQMKMDSNGFGDAFKKTTEGLKSSWKTFTNALLSFDFKGLGDKIKNAFNAGKEGYNATDAAGEWAKALGLQSAEQKKHLADLRATAKNEKLTLEERKAAQREYNDTVAKLARDEMNASVRESRAKIGTFLTQHGEEDTESNRKALKTLFREVITDESLLNSLAGVRGNKRVLTEDERAEALKKITRRGYDSQMVQSLIRLSAIYKNANTSDLDDVYEAVMSEIDAKNVYDSSLNQLNEMLDEIQPATSNSPGTTKKKSELKKIKFRKDSFKPVDMTSTDREIDRMFNEAMKVDDLPDVTELWSGMKAPVEWAESFKEYTDILMQVKDVTGDTIDQISDLMNKGFFEDAGKAVDFINEMADAVEDANKRIKEAMVSGFSEGIQTLMDGLMGVKSLNGKEIFGALLSPMADACVMIGEMLVAVGVGETAWFKSLSNPSTAIAAGTALIAIGALAKSTITKAINGVSGSGGGGSSATSTSSLDSIIDTELHIVVDTYATGSTIESVVNSEKRKNSR